MSVFEYHKAGNSEAQQKAALAYLLAQSSTGKAQTGVLSGLAVAQETTASGKVTVGAGAAVAQSAVIDGASMLVNDTQTVLDVLGPNPVGGLPRNDIVVLDRATTGLRVITGTPNAVPTDPTVPATAVPLARLRLPASATTIPTSVIDDLRTYTQLLSGSPWRDFTPTLYNNMNATPVAIGTDVSYARWRYVSPNTVQAQAAVTRQSGVTTSGGIGVALPIPGAIRSLNCGSLIAAGSNVPANQSGIAMMSPDRSKLILTNYAVNYLDLAPLMSLRFNVTYEV